MTDPVSSTVAESSSTGHSLDGTGSEDNAETLLLPVGRSDGDRIEGLASTAAEVAGMMEMNVHVLHVFSPARFERAADAVADGTVPAPTPDDVVRRVDTVRKTVRTIATPLWNWGMRIDIEGRVGESVSDEIVAAAEDVGAKHILIGGRRRTPTGKVVFGSTAQEVLLDAPCPITFVRDD